MERLQRRAADHRFCCTDTSTTCSTIGPSSAPGARTPRAALRGPRFNVVETKEAFVYRVEVPGLGEGDVDVQVEDEALLLRGERKSEVPEGYEVHLRERAPIAFARKLPLPGRVDAEGITASVKRRHPRRDLAQGQGHASAADRGEGAVTPSALRDLSPRNDFTRRSS